MKLKQYLNEDNILEMSKEMSLDSGHTITKRALERLKKETKSEDEFMEKIGKKVKLTSSDIRRLKASYKDI